MNLSRIWENRRMPKSNKYLRITMRGGLRVNNMIMYY